MLSLDRDEFINIINIKEKNKIIEMVTLHAKNLNGLKITSSLFFLDGTDVYWRDSAVDFFKGLVPPDFFDFNFKVVTGAAEELEAAAGSIPLMSEYAVVFVRSPDSALKESEKLLIKKAVSRISEGILMLFEDSEMLEPAEKKNAVGIDCKKLSEQECMPIVMAIAKELDVSITNFHASSLVTFNNCDLTRIKNELIKLRDYAGREVNDGDFIKLAIPDTEHQAYEFINAVAAKNKNFALTLLNDMKSRGIQSSFILVMLSNQYRKMLHSVLSTAPQEELMRALNITSPYAFSKTKQAAQKYSKIELKNIVDLLNGLEYRFKSGELINDASALDIAVGELMSL